ncbi:MAG: hypothetical protein VB934_07870, partial [Polyangiaceae bacterium]
QGENEMKVPNATDRFDAGRPLSDDDEQQLQELFDSTTTRSAQREARMAAAAERIPEEERRRRSESVHDARYAGEDAYSKIGETADRLSELPRAWWSRPQNLVAMTAAAAAAILLMFNSMNTTPSAPKAPIVAENTSPPPPSATAAIPSPVDDEEMQEEDVYLSALGVDPTMVDPWASIELLDGPENDDDTATWEAGYEAAFEDG